jgi:hypothetical protein
MNRLNPYESGWLSMLVARGLATEAEAREAQHRVARAAIDEMEARRAAKRALKKRLKRRRPKND